VGLNIDPANVEVDDRNTMPPHHPFPYPTVHPYRGDNRRLIDIAMLYNYHFDNMLRHIPIEIWQPCMVLNLLDIYLLDSHLVSTVICCMGVLLLSLIMMIMMQQQIASVLFVVAA
jgi:hypothetical protein